MLEKKENREIYYDNDLDIEVYRLSGIVQKFPNHFHEYYVIGFIEGGKRHLWCKNKEYDLTIGDLILFNPHDNHYCVPMDGERLDYRALNIKTEVMKKAVKEITGQDDIPHFIQTVVYQSEIVKLVRDLYNTILNQSSQFEKDEAFFLLLEQVLQEYTVPFHQVSVVKQDTQIQMLCTYIEENYSNNITLDNLTSLTSYGKSYLLRSFTKQVGVSPYRYLQNVRLNHAKKMLEQGILPIDAALLSGFSDQSHFTNFFKEFIGLTPKQYQRIFIDKIQEDK